jgi:hypothetical protein
MFSRYRKLKILKEILRYSKRQGDCLICYKCLDSAGRPRISVNGASYRISRMMLYLIKDFDLNSKSLVLHDDSVCIDKACIEIEHLKIGTDWDNQLDWRKHRPIDYTYCKRGHLRTADNVDNSGHCITCEKKGRRIRDNK